MEAAAYYVAVLYLVTVPALLVVWFLIHPFVATWRRLGAARTYALVAAVMAATAAVVFRFREPLLRTRFEPSVPLVVLAFVLLAIGLYIAVLRSRSLSMAILIGLPEVSPRHPDELITEGIYAQIRNPRYVEGLFLLAAGAVFSQYLAIYLLLAAYGPVIYVIVVLEERELRGRFGAAYEEYCRHVPRFFPRLHRQEAS